MDLLAERFKKRVEEIKQRKPNSPDEEGRLVIQPFNKEEFKQWARDQIRYLEVSRLSCLI